MAYIDPWLLRSGKTKIRFFETGSKNPVPYKKMIIRFLSDFKPYFSFVFNLNS